MFFFKFLCKTTILEKTKHIYNKRVHHGIFPLTIGNTQLSLVMCHEHEQALNIHKDHEEKSIKIDDGILYM